MDTVSNRANISSIGGRKMKKAFRGVFSPSTYSSSGRSVVQRLRKERGGSSKRGNRAGNDPQWRGNYAEARHSGQESPPWWNQSNRFDYVLCPRWKDARRGKGSRCQVSAGLGSPERTQS